MRTPTEVDINIDPIAVAIGVVAIYAGIRYFRKVIR